jgi:DALR anticodon binding domain
VHHISQVVKYTAIKQFIYSKLLDALSIYTGNGNHLCIESEKIPLYKGRKNCFLLYISGVALRLKNSHNCAMHLASDLANVLSEVCGEDLKVMVREPGWLDIIVAEPIISIWLQNLVYLDGEFGKMAEMGKVQQQAPLFSAQYAHARCCSLIRLCVREGIIKLKEVDLNVNSRYQGGLEIIHLGHEILPSPLPWLDSNNKLRFYENAERLLLSELIQVVDDIVCPNPNSSVNWRKATLTLSQAFDNFWRYCRIVKNNDLEQARSRFGLVLAVRSVLQFLLEKELGVSALFEL